MSQGHNSGHWALGIGQWEEARGTRPRVTWWTRVGIGGFTFFLLKGLLWLAAPVLFALMR